MVLSPFRIVVFFLLLAIVSVFALPKLRVDLIPALQASELNIYFALPYASPEVVEQQATAPLENIFSYLSQLNTIESKSFYNRGQIRLIFDPEVDMEMKKFEVSSLIRWAYPQLASSLSYPIIEETMASDAKSKSPLLVYAIAGPASSYELKRQSEEIIQKPLLHIRGLQETQITGSGDLQVSVEFDESKLRFYGLSPQSMLASIMRQFQTNYPGIVRISDEKQFFLRIHGTEHSLRSIRNILVNTPDSLTLKISDIAEVFLEEQDPNQYFRINGKNSVNLAIYAQEGENAIKLASEIKNAIALFSVKLPKGFEVRLEYDNTEFLTKELNKNYRRTFLSVFILIFFIIFSYRSWRYMLILFFALIVNVTLTILFAWYFRINIHLYTLAGVAVSFGIMIDNAIVMLDYYHQYRNRKVFLALLGATLTTITALLLVFLLPEEDRKDLSDFVSIIAIALTSSLLSSLFFIPAIYDLLFGSKANSILNVHEPDHRYKTRETLKRSSGVLKLYQSIIYGLARYRKILIVFVILLFGLPVFMLPSKWEDHDWYNSTFGSDIYLEKIRPYIDKCLGGSLRLFVRNVYEKGLYRNPEETKLYVMAQLPFGNSIEQMNYILKHVEQYLGTVGGIDKFVTHVYSGQYGSIEITFDEASEKGTLPYRLKSRLIAQSLDWGGVDWMIYGVGQGFSNAIGDEIPSFQVLMKGYNYDELKKQASIFAQKLLKHNRIQKVNTDEQLSYTEKTSQEYALYINHKNLGLIRTTTSEIFDHLLTVSKPSGVSAYINLNNQIYPLVMKEKKSNDFSIWRMMNEPLFLTKGKAVKLNTLSKLHTQRTSSAIHKKDRQYFRVVSFEYYGSNQFGEKYLKEVLEEMKNEMPIGYTAERNYWSWSTEKIKRQYLLIALLILANFIICSILFESLRQPFFIIITIPVAFIGLFLTFGWFGFYFDQGGYAAFVMLGGLSVNAAIFIVNDFNRKLVKGRNPNRRLIKTIGNRSRTILITTISTCCGMIPFLIEGQQEVFWFSLAAGTIGGLIMSLFAVFVVLPVLMWRLNVDN